MKSGHGYPLVSNKSKMKNLWLHQAINPASTVIIRLLVRNALEIELNENGLPN
jgi:hypothetical protein